MLKSFFLYLLSVTLLTSILPGQNDLYANVNYEPDYKVEIIKSNNCVSAPSIYCNFWKAHTFITFDNGLKGSSTTEWIHESQAKQKSEFSPPSGSTNILPTNFYETTTFSYRGEDSKHHAREYRLILENQEYNKYTTLALNTDHNFDCNPKIVSISENIESIDHWFYTEYSYKYILELDNGMVLTTKPSKNQWQKQMFELWNTGTRIIICGISDYICLFNVETLIENPTHNIENQKYTLWNLELIN